MAFTPQNDSIMKYSDFPYIEYPFNMERSIIVFRLQLLSEQNNYTKHMVQQKKRKLVVYYFISPTLSLFLSSGLRISSENFINIDLENLSNNVTSKTIRRSVNQLDSRLSNELPRSKCRITGRARKKFAILLFCSVQLSSTVEQSSRKY